MRPKVQQIKQSLDAIEADLQQRKHLVLEALDIFAQACTVAPLTSQVWTKAYLRWRANMPPFKELDCLILATLLSFLQRRKARLAIFLTLDLEDFDHPEVHTAFRQRKVLVSFEPNDVIMQFRKFYGVA